MATVEQKELLDEHLPYEVLMMRYAFETLRNPQPQLAWNAHLESFAVHVRNLVHFLRNKESNLNFKARDFIEDYQASEVKEIEGALSKLESQIRHLGKNRKTEPKDKVNPGRIDKLFKWTENGVERFLQQLPAELRDLYNEAKSRPTGGEITTPSASNHAISITTSTEQAVQRPMGSSVGIYRFLRGSEG